MHAPSRQVAKMQVIQLFPNRVRIRVQVFCSQHWYTGDCSVHCQEQDDDIEGHYTCDQDQGTRICEPGGYCQHLWVTGGVIPCHMSEEINAGISKAIET